MVTETINKGIVLLAVLLLTVACDKPFSLDLPLAVDSHKYSLTSKAGNARIFFYTTKAWTLSMEPSDCSWGSVNKTSGDGKDDVEELIFSYGNNTGADRQVIIVISAGELQEKITISQKGVAREWWNGSTSVDDLNTVNP